MKLINASFFLITCFCHICEGYTYLSSDTDIYSGSYEYIISLNTATINFYGGGIQTLESAASSTVNLRGASIRSLRATENGTIHVYGGRFEAIGSTNCAQVLACNQAKIVFHGYDFSYDPVECMLHGFLSDGQEFWARLQVPSTGTTLERIEFVVTSQQSTPECLYSPKMDFTGDCRVNLADLAIFLQSWLECNLLPEEACFQ